MQIVETVDAIRRTVRESGIVLEGPALLAKPRNGDGEADRTIQFLKREIDLRAVRPRAGVGDIEVIAPGLGFEAGRAVSCDAVAKGAVHPLEIAGLAGFRGRVLVSPLAVDQHAHQAASPRARAAAWRIAAIFVR